MEEDQARKPEVVVYDIETGGIDKLHSPITQIAAIACDATTLEPGETFEQKVLFKNAPVSHDALAIQGYDPEVWNASGLHLRQALARFADFLRGHACFPVPKAKGGVWYAAQLAGYNNLSFDQQFLRRDFSSPDWQESGPPGTRLFYPARYQEIDAYQMVVLRSVRAHLQQPDPERYALDLGLMELPNLKLKTVYEYLTGEELESAHDALADVKATIRVFQRMGWAYQ